MNPFPGIVRPIKILIALLITVLVSDGLIHQITSPHNWRLAPDYNLSSKEGILGMKRILYVEDEMQVRRMVCRYLKEAGFEVRPASDGLEALEVFTKADPRPDLVLTDVNMPLMNGVDLSRRIRDLAPDQKIMICSSHDRDGLVTKGLDPPEGVLLIQKPFSVRELIAQVCELLA